MSQVDTVNSGLSLYCPGQNSSWRCLGAGEALQSRFLSPEHLKNHSQGHRTN